MTAMKTKYSWLNCEVKIVKRRRALHWNNLNTPNTMSSNEEKNGKIKTNDRHVSFYIYFT